MRDAQLAALSLPKVGYATNADHGAACNIHPPPKQYCGKRLGDSALALQYGKPVAWRSPSFASATSESLARSSVSVTVKLHDVSSVGLRADVFPFNYVGGMNCTALNNKTAGTCAWAAIQLANGRQTFLNATMSVVSGGQALLLEAGMPEGSDGTVVSVSYGYGAIPLMNLYDRGTGLPVLPFNRSVSSLSSIIVV